ncbi:hypothetical protein L1987_42858 [Smallanthus sonchifolius]|uniref:Uncharacterized protein n=1 Tax=Smallanthus sonchifolius TaxID=185202 RepID=A0ACB9GJY0_9ASTR|nr:hypothetical protein L1987_42858 [Smallanthus sonchifolius]
MVKPLFPNPPPTPTPTHVAKICKSEAHFSIQELSGANVYRWETNCIPSNPLFTFEQPDFVGMDHFFNTSGGGHGGARSGATSTTSDRSNVVASSEEVGFNELLLPTI